MATTKSPGSARKPAGKSGTRRPAQRRSQPRKPEAQGSNAVTLGAIAMGAAAALGAAAYGIFALLRRPSEGTVPSDLMSTEHPDGSERAIADFRPDPTAAVPDSERDQFRPALAGAAAPTLVRGQARELERLDAAPS